MRDPIGRARRALLDEFRHFLAEEIEKLKARFEPNDNRREQELDDERVEHRLPANLVQYPFSIVAMLDTCPTYSMRILRTYAERKHFVLLNTDSIQLTQRSEDNQREDPAERDVVFCSLHGQSNVESDAHEHKNVSNPVGSESASIAWSKRDAYQENRLSSPSTASPM